MYLHSVEVNEVAVTERLSYCIGWGIRSQIFHWVFGFLYQAAHVISLA